MSHCDCSIQFTETYRVVCVGVVVAAFVLGTGMPNQQLMREMENVYSEGEPLLAELN